MKCEDIVAVAHFFTKLKIGFLGGEWGEGVG